MKTEKVKIVILLVTSVLSLLGVFYVLNQDKPLVVSESQKQTLAKTSIIRVTLKIVGSNSEKDYIVKVANNSTFVDVLETLRKKGLITYDLTSYTYGDEITSVNGVGNTSTLQWNLYVNNAQFTDSPKSLKIVKNSVYSLKYERSDI